MTPPISQRLAALQRDTAAFNARVDRVAGALPSGAQRTPDVLAKVQPLYHAAADLQARAQSLAGAMKLGEDVFHGPVKDANRAAATILLPAHNAARSVTQRTLVGEHAHAPVTTSVTPGSDASTANYSAAMKGEDLPNVRIVGSIPRPAANLSVDRLENVPQQVIHLTDELGDRAVLFSGKLTDVYGFHTLKGVHPRGWPKGKTWDVVPGVAFDHGFAANPNRDRKGSGHGSTSLQLHEYGHVVDKAIATSRWDAASSSDAFRDGAWREMRRREAPTPYLKDYAEEWFAEGFARYTKSQQSAAALARWYPQTYSYLKEHVGQPQYQR